MKIMHKKNAVLVALMLIGSASVAQADIGVSIARPAARGSAGSTTVNVTGTITAKPCDLNAGKDLDYAFGDVVVNDVTGEKHAITHPLKIECYSTSEQAQVRFTGTAASTGTNVLQAGSSGLGIALYNSAAGGQIPLALNSYIDVANDETVQLKAVLTHLDPSKLLKAGDFSAALTIETRYQ